jgi:tRNA pseudouridine38-40 synthase
VLLEFESEGFLYKMVRNITGTLLEVGTGRRSVEDIKKIFEAEDRCSAGRAAPALGLCLIEVRY